VFPALRHSRLKAPGWSSRDRLGTRYTACRASLEILARIDRVSTLPVAYSRTPLARLACGLRRSSSNIASGTRAVFPDPRHGRLKVPGCSSRDLLGTCYTACRAFQEPLARIDRVSTLPVACFRTPLARLACGLRQSSSNIASGTRAVFPGPRHSRLKAPGCSSCELLGTRYTACRAFQAALARIDRVSTLPVAYPRTPLAHLACGLRQSLSNIASSTRAVFPNLRHCWLNGRVSVATRERSRSVSERSRSVSEHSRSASEHPESSTNTARVRDPHQ
jgi:hypothetical protein